MNQHEFTILSIYIKKKKCITKCKKVANGLLTSPMFVVLWFVAWGNYQAIVKFYRCGLISCWGFIGVLWQGDIQMGGRFMEELYINTWHVVCLQQEGCNEWSNFVV